MDTTRTRPVITHQSDTDSTSYVVVHVKNQVLATQHAFPSPARTTKRPSQFRTMPKSWEGMTI